MADNEWTVNATTQPSSNKKKKGKGKKKNNKNNELVVASPNAIVPKSTKPPKEADNSIEKRNNAREFFSKMYTSGERLSEDRLESRPQYAANDGVWNAQSDLWLREAQLTSQGMFQQQIAKFYQEFDKIHGTESFVPSGSLKEPLDPFNVRCSHFPLVKNSAGVLVYPPNQKVDVLNHAKESEDYFAKCIKEKNLNKRAQQLSISSDSPEESSHRGGSGGRGGEKNKKQYPAWYLNCKGDIEDDEDDDEDDQVDQPQTKNGSAAAAAADDDDGKANAQKEEKKKIKSEVEKQKERSRTEKLARITRHTPWDQVAQRLSDLHALEATPRDCCRRFALTYSTFEKQDSKSKQNQLNMQLKRGPPSSKGRGDAVLAIACLSGRSVSTTEVIINMGADVDNRSSSDGATPFLRACEGGNPHIAKLLLDKGADRFAETRDGRNGVHIAAQFKWPDLVEVLLDEGAPKCTIPRCARCKLVWRLIEKKRAEKRKQKLANGTGGVRTPEERKAAIDAAMAAFEQEFGTFEDEVEADDSYF